MLYFLTLFKNILFYKMVFIYLLNNFMVLTVSSDKILVLLRLVHHILILCCSLKTQQKINYPQYRIGKPSSNSHHFIITALNSLPLTVILNIVLSDLLHDSKQRKRVNKYFSFVLLRPRSKFLSTSVTFSSSLLSWVL